MNTLAAALARSFAGIVLAVAILAHARPQTFLFALPHVPALLGIVMFGMGATLTLEDFGRVARHPRQVAVGVAAQYGIMPLAAWAIALLLGLPPEIAVGLVLVGASPGGTASNVITLLARGDVALSVSFTAVSTVLAPVLTPALVWLLAGRWLEVPAADLLISTLRIVLVPVILGITVRHLLPRAVLRIVPLLPAVSVAAIALIVGAVVGNSQAILLTSGAAVLVAVVLHNCAGLALGWTLGGLLRLGEPQRRTLSIEVGMQNSGLAVALAAAHLGPLAALPGALFTVWHNISGSLVASWMARREPTGVGLVSPDLELHLPPGEAAAGTSPASPPAN